MEVAVGIYYRQCVRFIMMLFFNFFLMILFQVKGELHKISCNPIYQLGTDFSCFY